MPDAFDKLLHPIEDSTPDIVDGVALARLYGEPLFDIPKDLYIPPDALEVFLETFEGPLDLLLYLIRKQNFNVLDIPMAEVTQQYLSYVEQIRKINLELAAEYLLMAAMLIEIKSRLLLPAPKGAEEEEPLDPRAELVRRLLTYERFKLAAQRIDALPQNQRDFQVSKVFLALTAQVDPPSVQIDELHALWLNIVRRAKLHSNHQIRKESLSVREHMTHILRILQNRQFIEFEQFFHEQINSNPQVEVIVVFFIALLELCKESLVEITQVEPFAPIYVRLSFAQMK